MSWGMSSVWPELSCDESLMSTPVVVVRKNVLEHALSFDEQVARSLFEGAMEPFIADRARPVGQRRATEKAGPEHRYGEQTSHVTYDPAKH